MPITILAPIRCSSLCGFACVCSEFYGNAFSRSCSDKCADVARGEQRAAQSKRRSEDHASYREHYCDHWRARPSAFARPSAGLHIIGKRAAPPWLPRALDATADFTFRPGIPSRQPGNSVPRVEFDGCASRSQGRTGVPRRALS
jgi:hypothetical protein